jgi:hypothetical protein
MNSFTAQPVCANGRHVGLTAVSQSVSHTNPRKQRIRLLTSDTAKGRLKRETLKPETGKKAMAFLAMAVSESEDEENFQMTALK